MRNGRPGAVTSVFEDTTTGIGMRDLGPLPEWNLVDLYPSMDSPAFKGDLRDVALEAEAFHAGEEDAEEIAADDVGATALAEKLGRD